MNIEGVYKLVSSDLDKTNDFIKKNLKSKVSFLNVITHYMMRKKGKQLRPMIVILTSRMCGGYSDDTIIASSMVELLHTATLVHDDIVDEAEKRRGVFTINKIWKNKASVLIGDYMMSKGLLIALENEKYDFLQELSNAVKEMSEGELKQLEKTKRLNITENEYYEIISKKTASLIKSSFRLGAISANADVDTIEKASEIGFNIGMAFQIKDDLLDFSEKSGKNIGGDIKEKKLTLPLIFTLNKLPTLDRIKLKSSIRFNGKSEENIKKIISQIEQSGGIEYSEQRMKFHIDKSKELLSSFQDNEYKEAILCLIDYIVNREK